MWVCEIMDDKEELIKELQWVKYRIRMLELIEEKLLLMRNLVEIARDNELNENEVRKINEKIEKLIRDINALDEESREDYIY